MRFKIDLYQNSVDAFGLYVLRRRFLRWRWEYIERFNTREKAKAFYETIKDLPEFLK